MGSRSGLCGQCGGLAPGWLFFFCEFGGNWGDETGRSCRACQLRLWGAASDSGFVTTAAGSSHLCGGHTYHSLGWQSAIVRGWSAVGVLWFRKTNCKRMPEGRQCALIRLFNKPILLVFIER